MDAFQSGKHYRHRSKPSSTAPSIVNQAPCSTGLRHVKIPITEAAQLLRGLVQHVLSPAATLALSPRLDCLQALRDKTLYVRQNRGWNGRIRGRAAGRACRTSERCVRNADI